MLLISELETSMIGEESCNSKDACVLDENGKDEPITRCYVYLSNVTTNVFSPLKSS